MKFIKSIFVIVCICVICFLSTEPALAESGNVPALISSKACEYSFTGYSPSASTTEKSTVDEGTCGTNANWKFYSDGELFIYGSGSTDNSSAFASYKDQISSVRIDEGITDISDNLFNSYINLSSVELPDSLISIGNYSFYNCESLTLIFIPDNVSTIGSYAFAETSISMVQIPASVGSIGAGAFASSSLEGIKVNINNPVYKSSVGGALLCGDDILISYPGGRLNQLFSIPSGVATIYEAAFMNCEYLEFVSLPSSIVEIGDSAFKDCKSLKAIEIPDGITDVSDDLLSSCSSLEIVILPASLESLDNVFDGCNHLQTLHFLGSQSAWDNVVKEDCDFLNNVDVHFVEKSNNTIKGLYEKVIYCEDCGLEYPKDVEEKIPAIVNVDLSFKQRAERFTVHYNVFNRKYVALAVTIYDMDGNKVSGEGRGYNIYSYINQTFVLETDLGHELIPGTEYQYRIDISYADTLEEIERGQERHAYSEFYSFVMPGEVTEIFESISRSAIFSDSNLSSCCIWFEFTATEDISYSVSAEINPWNQKANSEGWFVVMSEDLKKNDVIMFSEGNTKDIYLLAGDKVYISVYSPSEYDTVVLSVDPSVNEVSPFDINVLDVWYNILAVDVSRFSKSITGSIYLSAFDKNGKMIWGKSDILSDDCYKQFNFSLTKEEVESFNTINAYIVSSVDMIPICEVTEYQKPNEIKIGASGPLSGTYSSYGNSIRNGVEIAIEEINSQELIQFKFEMYDDYYDSDQALTAYSQLKEWGMDIYLGSVMSGTTLPVAAEAADDNIFLLSPSADNPVIRYGNDNVYQMCLSIFDYGKVAAEYISQNFTTSNVGILCFVDETYSLENKEGFYEVCSESGISVVTASVSYSDTDYDSTINELKDSNVEIVFLPMSFIQMSQIITAANELDYHPVWFGTDQMEYLLSIESFDVSLVNGCIFLSPYYISTNTDFYNKYLDHFGYEPNFFAASAYDCIYALFNAVCDGQVTSDMSAEEICEIMIDQFTTMKFNGLTGSDVTWDETGRVSKKLSVVQINNGVFSLFQP